jgi:XRE family transcriptional regulator, aerobic/anaerobic benzoate catabolism transcriptional regulator
MPCLWLELSIILQRERIDGKPMAEIVTFSGQAKPALDAGKEREAKFAGLLATVGKRVREARQQARLSRRELSEKSGVSQRYIAQLETGQGNISIGLLMYLADALGLRIEWLVAEADPWESEVGAITMLLPTATRDQLERVLGILDPEHPSRRRANRIAFIGLRGAGKSTLGRLSADKLGLAFLELNDEIELASGMAVNEVMALYGQEGYRHLERGALERIVATHDAVILAVAGGIVANPDSFNYLLRNYHTVWLKAEPEEHMARVRGQGDERPMAGNPDAMEELRRILTSREALYARAATSVNTSKRTLEDSLTDVLSAIEDSGFLVC